MLKVIIVDDEYLVIESIKNCVKWNELGYELVGQALDGQQALELIEIEKPQLAIVDINMPFINGLEFSRITHRKYPDLKVIILTGYSNFEYAREAMRVGVTEYILKPVDKLELEKALTNQRIIIESGIAFKLHLRKLEEASRQNNFIVKEKFTQTYVLDNMNGIDIKAEHKFNEYYPDFCNGKVTVIAIKIDYIYENYKSEDDRQLFRFAVRNIFEEIFDNIIYIPLYDLNGNVILIINTLLNKGEIHKNGYVKLCQEGLQAVSRYLPFTITIGIGNEYESLDGIPSSYKEAVEALRNSVIIGNNRIIKYSSLESKNKSYVNIIKLRKNIQINLRIGSNVEIEKEIEEVFSIISSEKLLISDLHFIISELLLIGKDFANESEIDPMKFSEQNLNSVEILESFEELVEIKEYILRFYQNLSKYLNGSRKTGSKMLVEKSKAYIDNNLGKSELDLENIAGSIFINASYLSSIFKKETGISITDYVKESRMIKAKELIKEGYKNIIALAQMVGFEDVNYFRKCFKKTFGVTPSEYLDLIKE